MLLLDIDLSVSIKLSCIVLRVVSESLFTGMIFDNKCGLLVHIYFIVALKLIPIALPPVVHVLL